MASTSPKRTNRERETDLKPKPKDPNGAKIRESPF